ncbi:MAG: DUF4377 domain-containing protein [Gammaproteobacteria bacterium]|nr:DUF4377 domain-containing protein [Gammaproteobacteria bacterium]
MVNKLLTGIVLLALTACSEPSVPEPPLAIKQPDESGVYPPVITAPDGASLILWVAAEKRECMAVGPTECLQIRFHPNEEWQLLYGEIIGFEYQPGQVYQIEVSEVLIPEPPADAPDRQWVLRTIISSHAE